MCVSKMNNEIKLLELRRKMQENISKIKSAEDIFDLFKLLNYPGKVLFNTSSKRKKETFDFKKDDAQRIKEIYSILSFDENLPVFLLETNTLTPSFIRSVTTTFDRQYLHFLLIFASDYSEVVFVFPKREKTENSKFPKLKITKLIIDKNEIHYTDVQTLSDIYFEKEENWRDVWRKWNKSFSVERVTESFFKKYKEIFFTLRDELIKQNISRKESHEFTLQFLNRIMFIYFISRKRWLEHPRFIGWIWSSYKKLNKYSSEEFYEKWIRQVFFKAFNNRSNEITGLPEDVTKVISNSPYLNGGLFRQNNLDDLKIKITDRMFEKIFDFFEKYNFTIKEDMPLESEVAVDPQMIGYVYESLANVADEIYDRNDFGIFYTPRIEVDFMCRRSLVEYLSKHLPEVPKEKFYHLIFDLPEEKEKIEEWFAKEKLWRKLEETLDNLSVVDPACGSGAFLVGMLNVVAEIYRMIYKHMDRNLTDFQLKNRIIQYSLYGVDVMPWAIHAAELRLWLQIIVETNFKKEELRKDPLLPNLNLNLRIGDSLVQEIGGLTFNVRTNDLKPPLKKKLENLKQEKRKYFENSQTAKFKTHEEVKKEEVMLFEEIIDERIESLKCDIEVLRNSFEKRTKQVGLFGTAKVQIELEIKIDKEIDNKIKNNGEEIEKLTKIKGLLEDPEKKPFVWDIDFAEIFGDKNGFDIVIGNPPYVRQEMISPPNTIKSEVGLEDRREYKEKRINSVKSKFPDVSGIDKRSDYYIYFYFHGLSLLNEKGTFTFITSNSWLDVGYGKELQEFLLKRAPIIAVYDNPKRSFSHADVNTIIALFGCPVFKEEIRFEDLKAQEIKNWPMLNNTAKFVMFKKPFEEVLSAKNLIEIDVAKATIKGQGITELVKNVVKTDDYRVFPVTQEDLLEDGWEYPEDYDKTKGRFKSGSYEGNKWGGKYLRAPDIFYTILEKGKGKLIELRKFGNLKRGVTTGLNEFFYFDEKQIKEWKIENEFLKLAIVSPRNCESIYINKKQIKRFVFLCHRDKKELIGTNALKYIKWGESQAFHKKPSFSNNKKWYSLRENSNSDIILYKHVGDKEYPIKNDNYFVNNVLYEISLLDKKDMKGILSFLSSSFIFLFEELQGQVGLGEGALVLKVPDWKKCPVFRIDFSNEGFFRRPIKSIFEELGINPDKPIREQEPAPLSDRAELDNIIFDELGLSEDKRKEVYWSVCEMVKQRLDKAGSLKKKK
ncbi:MAG: hypothetical protein CVT88_01680 [Candidatus Altiarchaeales archaeon HGW-Altiarchaeales-1]|nr:MAG: hypothetical protein CVT88_01680 [Candidatus Altiarchaeales archaeon HGW-Altiarchaeales-1]